MTKVRHSCILSIGPVGFAPTMACSVAIIYFTMVKWFLKCGVGSVLSALILDAPVSINQISRSDSGVCTVSMSCFWRSTARGDDIRRILCLSLCLAVIMADLEVIEVLFQNKRLLVITSLINL